MKAYVAGEWVSADEMIPVHSPYSGDLIDEVPATSDAQVQSALAAAVEGAKQMAALPASERLTILLRVADLFVERAEDLAQTLSAEQGKPISESRVEVARMPDLLRISGFEGTQARGETLPLDAQAGAAGKLGFTLRVPCGIVVAITPFNFPILLAVHKLGPALASGNAVILKPPNLTPLTGLKVTELFLEAGVPPLGVQCLTGQGSRIGPMLCADPRVRKISFTGSAPVGEQITRVAGIKKLSLELGSNSPLIVMADADMDQVAKATAVGGYSNAGQVCISTQRVLVDRSTYANFLDATKAEVQKIKVGPSLDDATKLSAMVSETEAQRVESWVSDAVANGANLITGGQRDKAVYQPTIVADVDPAMRISCEELFGPAIAVTPVDNIDQAIALANDSRFGLSCGIFTRDVNAAMRFAREADSGNVMINWPPQWRADFMPYGGFKQSGIGKEGPRYAVQEMTELKTVVVHGIDD
ncbi:MAG: aldehyde dehydrogenase [Planctomycetaceae bacterium]|nr:aldehyde dehydrogenase [Planctomycetaceae bacterium]